MKRSRKSKNQPMTAVEEYERVKMCRQKNLCFFTLKPLVNWEEVESPIQKLKTKVNKQAS